MDRKTKLQIAAGLCAAMVIFHAFVGRHIAPNSVLVWYYIGIGVVVGMAMEWSSLRR